MQLKDPFDTKLCTLNVIVLSVVAVVTREKKGMKVKTVKTQLPPHEVHDEVHEFDKEQQWLAKQRKCMIVLRNDHTHRSLNSFNEHFAVFFDLQFFGSHVCCTWTTSPKACAMPTNGNTHMSVQR